ncbi:holin [Streptomyces sp. AMCC400023]|uniref:holin n=1 Tax=Streptomyces sp. AMCC400023 TaxID=2056258 RepID=UPI001F21EA73|nr:holin [Streptomyces sp. AMCC400023]UJV43801.1 holin [Streptomyces sp. AMCC400023]
MASSSAPIEKKVKASSAVAYLVSLAGLAILGAVTDDPSLISSMPDALEPFVLALVPAAASWVAGWAAPHTPRSDA